MTEQEVIQELIRLVDRYDAEPSQPNVIKALYVPPSLLRQLKAIHQAKQEESKRIHYQPIPGFSNRY